MDSFLWNTRKFKYGDKVKHRRDGYVGEFETVSPQGVAWVKVGNTYEFPNIKDLEFADEQKEKNEPKVSKKKFNIDYLG